MATVNKIDLNGDTYDIESSALVTTQPTTPTEWAVYYDTVNDEVKVYDGSNWNSVWWGGAVAFATSDTAWNVAEKEVSIPSITELNTWQVLYIKPTASATVANLTIKLNNFTAYPIRYNNWAITTTTDDLVWNQNFVSQFVFDGTYRQFVSHGYDNNTTYTQNILFDRGSFVAGSGTYAISRYIICLQKPDMTWEKITNTEETHSVNADKTVNTHGFLLNGEMLYYSNTTVLANGAVSAANTMYRQYSGFDIRYSANTSGTGYTTGDYIYLVGTIGVDGLFYLDTTQWWDNTLPSTNNGKVYVKVGKYVSGVTVTLELDHPAYYHDGTRIREYKVADNKQDKSNMVTTLSWADDNHYPTAKAVADAIQSSWGGDMLASTYDPNNIWADAFDYTNFTNTPTIPSKTSDLNNDSWFITSSALSGYQTTANLKTSLSDNSDSYYPSQKAVKTAIDGKQDSLTTQTAYTNKGTTTKVPQISTNTLWQVTSITEKNIAFPVTSVNGSTWAVTVTVPTKVSDLTNDSWYTTNTGTITSVKMNGSTVSSSWEADLWTVITSHQSIKTINNNSLVWSGNVTINEPIVSSTAPSSPTEWMIWYDTTNDKLKTYDGSNWNECWSGWGGNENVKYFELSSQSDLTTAQEIYDWNDAGGFAIILYNNVKYYNYFYQNGTLYLMAFPTLVSGWNSDSSWWADCLLLLTTNWEVTTISQSTVRLSKYLATDVNYSTPYTPLYNWSPATKKYVDDNAGWNTKTFYLSSTSDLTNAQAAYDWYLAGKNPIIIYDNKSYIIYSKAGSYIYFANSSISSATYQNSVTQIRKNWVSFTLSGSTVTAINLNNDYSVTSYLSTATNYSTPYTPLYNGSPATKKYVDDSVSVVSGDSWTTYTIKVSNSAPASWTPNTTITFRTN